VIECCDDVFATQAVTDDDRQRCQQFATMDIDDR
jgi:hypothetical protein